MPSILISEEDLSPLVILYCIHSHASRILLRILYVSRERCGALPEVSTGSHVSSSAQSCHSVFPIPHPHLHGTEVMPYERPRQ